MAQFHGNARYQVIRELGAGGMGLVYEVEDRQAGRRVALKTLQRAHPGAIARFKREFRSLADVVHPNLVGLYELATDSEQLFFTMELVDGIRFDRWVRGASVETAGNSATPVTEPVAPQATVTTQTGVMGHPAPTAVPVDLARLRDGLRQLAEGIAAIHEAGMLHRDLKPSNVLVCRSGRVVLLDFGLVTDLAAETSAHADERPLEGTIAYMSPEQAARSPLTPSSDWYSLGVILYVALTGMLPYRGSREDMLMDKQRHPPLPPSSLVANVPNDLDRLCCDLLAIDPGDRPGGGEILRRVGSDVVPTTHSSSKSHVSYGSMIGRERELAAMEQAQREAMNGSALVARVFGPSGIGKSGLVRAFIDSLDSDCVVLRGRCYEQESVPFKAVDGVIDALAQHLRHLPDIEVEGLMPRRASPLAELFPVLRQVGAFVRSSERVRGSVDPQERRRRAFESLRELFARLSDRHPLVLAIDDLQWGDADSATLLASLLRPPDAPALLFVASYRDDDVDTSAFLSSFAQLCDNAEIPHLDIAVEPLSFEDSRELARTRLADEPALQGHAGHIAREAQGNPLFVEELCRHVRNQVSAQGVSLEAALRTRVSRLPEPAGRLLATIAVAGRPIERETAMRAAGATEPQLLAELRAGSFIRTRAAGDLRYVEPYHDRIREVAAGGLTAEQLAETHGWLARALEATRNPDPEWLAVHCRAAGEYAHAASYALVAAKRAAESLAFDRAARLYRMVLELTPDSPERHAHLLALAHALENAGRGGEAAEAYEAAVPTATPSEALALRSRACAQLLRSGHLDRGLAGLETVLAELGLPSARSVGGTIGSFLWHRLRLRLHGLRFRETEEREIPASRITRLDMVFAAVEGFAMSDTLRSAAFQVRALRLALELGEPRRVVRALIAEVVFASLPGRRAHKRSQRTLDVALELATRLGDPESLGLAAAGRSIQAFNEGRFGESLEQAEVGSSLFREHCVGTRWELATLELFQMFTLVFRGRLRQLVSDYPARLEEAQAIGDKFSSTTMEVAMGFFVPLMRDDVARARAVADRAIADWSHDGFHLQHTHALNTGICLDLYAGDGAGAVARVEGTWPTLKKSLFMQVQVMRAVFWGARGRAFLGAARADPAMLREVRRAARKLRREQTDYCRAEASLLEAGVAHLQDDDVTAVRLLTEAEALRNVAQMELFATCTRYVRGRLIGGAEGAAAADGAAAILREQGVVNPAAFARMLAPGFH